jgi:predicted transcriptional regulator
MQRGRNIYLSLFDNEKLQPAPVVERRGRSEMLVQRRNELLLHRHFFYYKIKRVQYHIGLQALEQEFFLTERTIVDIVQNDNVVLKTLKSINPDDAKYFKRKFPFMNWE